MCTSRDSTLRRYGYAPRLKEWIAQRLQTRESFRICERGLDQRKILNEIKTMLQTDTYGFNFNFYLLLLSFFVIYIIATRKQRKLLIEAGSKGRDTLIKRETDCKQNLIQ